MIPVKETTLSRLRWAAWIDVSASAQVLDNLQTTERPSEVAATDALNRLAQDYTRMSPEQQKVIREKITRNNASIDAEASWGSVSSRPRVAIEKGVTGQVRFSADWLSGEFLQGMSKSYSKKYLDGSQENY